MLKTNPLLALAIAASAMLTGCGTAGTMIVAPRMQAAPIRTMNAGDFGCKSGTRLYGSVGTFTIDTVTGAGKWAGEGTLLATLSATPDSKTKGTFKAELVLEGIKADQLKPGTVINGFVDYTCVANNTIVPQSTPYDVSNIRIVAER
ncbi:MAG TPA: hypothetical protein V6D47_12135 [Oscillatoriaceae cyanobacterium]